MSRRIPARFHFVFGLAPQTEPFHLVDYLCLESCRVVNRPESITLCYHHEPYGPYWDLIKEHLHLWSHLWWSDRRRDFSELSGGMLTERYVRSAETTYALLARRFLPARRPKLLFISPVMRRPTDDGRSMRAHRVLTGLASTYEVDLLVAESGFLSRVIRGWLRPAPAASPST